jgi:VWFA-related protein
MRAIALFLAAAATAGAQFRSTVPLVIAPTTVTDAKGRIVDGLTAGDLVVYDDNVPQAIQVEPLYQPVSLVVLIENSEKSAAMLDKLGRSGILFADLVSGDRGETAVLSFAGAVKVEQDFTANDDRIIHAVRALRAQDDHAAIYDAVMEGLRLLASRDPRRRRVMLVIAERRDRSSKIQLETVLRQGQLQNTTIYWLTYSTLLTPYTSRPRTKWDRMTDDEKNDPRRLQSDYKVKIPLPEEEEPLPTDLKPGDLIQVFTELAHRAKVDAAGLLSQATGGRTFNFLKQSGLEEAIQAVGNEVHRQYIVTFTPKRDAAGVFHTLRAEVKDHPELQARTRAGYWSIE